MLGGRGDWEFLGRGGVARVQEGGKRRETMENRIREPTLQGQGLGVEAGEARQTVRVCVCVCGRKTAAQMSQGRKSARVSRRDENKGEGAEGAGQEEADGEPGWEL